MATENPLHQILITSPVIRHSSTSETELRMDDDEVHPDSLDESEDEEDIAPLLGQLDVPALPDLDTIHSLHSQRKSQQLQDLDSSRSHSDIFGFGGLRKRTRLSTLAGFSVNHMTLLKLQLDAGNWLTIQVTSDTKAKDAIQKIIARRRIPPNVECKLYQDDVELADDAFLQQCIFVSSGAIQVRFKSNDLDIDFQDSLQSTPMTQSLISIGHSINNGDDDEDDDSHFVALSKGSNYSPNPNGHHLKNGNNHRLSTIGTASTPKHRPNDYISRHTKSSGDINALRGQSLPIDRSKIHRKHRSKSKTAKASSPLPRRSMLKTQNLTAFHTFSIQHTDDNDVARDQVLRNIENLLRREGRQQYEVIKINRFNKHQKRILKLTEFGIENVKPQKSGLLGTKRESVTSFHLWENVSNSYLEDANTIRISFKDYDLGDRKYQTNEASEINEHIQRRLKIIKDQKTSAGRDEISVKFQKQLILQQIANTKKFNIGDHVRLIRDRSGYIVFKGNVHFAPSEHYGIELDADNGDHDGMVDGKRYFTTDPKRGIMVPESHIIRKIQIKKARSPRAKRAMASPQMEITSPFMNGQSFSSQQHRRISKMQMDSGLGIGDQSTEDSIYKEIKDLILANNTIEGRYRVNFTNKFHKYAKEDTLLEMVRDFMDAVKVKIEEKHGARYRAQILRSWHLQKHEMKSMNVTIVSKKKRKKRKRRHGSKSIKHKGSTTSNPDSAISESKTPEPDDHEDDEEFDDDESSEEMKELSGDEKAAEMGTLSDVMNKLMESAIEQTILQAKIKEIYGICREKTLSETRILEMKMDRLRGKSQSFFGIKPELESATKWNRAVYELSLLRDCVLPSEKINALINTAHAIYLSNDKEQRERAKMREDLEADKTKESHFITGDDFLPIVIFVICQSTKDEPFVVDADLIFLEGLVDPAQGRGEAGYYLAVFHAALQWIRCFNN